MSVQAISWVLEHSQSRLGPRHVLISIANHAASDGTGAWPSIATIAREARLSEREVQRALPILEKSGELQVFRSKGPNGAHYFVLCKMMRPHCWYCGADLHLGMVTVDHQKPTSRGGKDELFNMVYACSLCNNAKHDATLEEYRKQIKAVLFFGEQPEGRQNVTRPQIGGRQIHHKRVTNPVPVVAEMSPEPSEKTLTVLKDKEELFQLIQDYHQGKTYIDEQGCRYKISPSSRKRIYIST